MIHSAINQVFPVLSPKVSYLPDQTVRRDYKCGKSLDEIVSDCNGMTPAELMVLETLVAHAQRYGQLLMSRQYIADTTGVHLSSVKRAYKILKTLGYIRTYPGFGGVPIIVIADEIQTATFEGIEHKICFKESFEPGINRNIYIYTGEAVASDLPADKLKDLTTGGTCFAAVKKECQEAGTSGLVAFGRSNNFPNPGSRFGMGGVTGPARDVPAVSEKQVRRYYQRIEQSIRSAYGFDWANNQQAHQEFARSVGINYQPPVVSLRVGARDATDLAVERCREVDEANFIPDYVENISEVTLSYDQKLALAAYPPDIIQQVRSQMRGKGDLANPSAYFVKVCGLKMQDRRGSKVPQQVSPQKKSAPVAPPQQWKRQETYDREAYMRMKRASDAKILEHKRKTMPETEQLSMTHAIKGGIPEIVQNLTENYQSPKDLQIQHLQAAGQKVVDKYDLGWIADYDRPQAEREYKRLTADGVDIEQYIQDISPTVKKVVEIECDSEWEEVY